MVLYAAGVMLALIAFVGGNIGAAIGASVHLSSSGLNSRSGSVSAAVGLLPGRIEYRELRLVLVRVKLFSESASVSAGTGEDFPGRRE